MRIYTDTMGMFEVRQALHDTWPMTTGVFIDHDKHEMCMNARKRKIRHDITLYGEHARHTRKRNLGTSSDRYRNGDDEYAATWMDWGWWIAVMFRYEPTAIIGTYDGIEDFHQQVEAQLPHRFKVDPSLKNFARTYAVSWEDHTTSPFKLVNAMCPPELLVDLQNRPLIESWLAS